MSVPTGVNCRVVTVQESAELSSQPEVAPPHYSLRNNKGKSISSEPLAMRARPLRMAAVPSVIEVELTASAAISVARSFTVAGAVCLAVKVNTGIALETSERTRAIALGDCGVRVARNEAASPACRAGTATRVQFAAKGVATGQAGSQIYRTHFTPSHRRGRTAIGKCA